MTIGTIYRVVAGGPKGDRGALLLVTGGMFEECSPTTRAINKRPPLV